jgi:hypothetical protein
MNRLRLAVIVFCFGMISLFPIVGFSQSSDDPETLLNNAPSKADYPDSESIILKDDVSYEYTSEGKVVKTIHRIIKLFTYADRGRWSEFRIDYRDGVDEVEVLQVRTIQKDGTIITQPDYAQVEVLPGAFNGVYDYHNYRQLVLPGVGMDEGCIMEWHIRVTRPVDNPIQFSGAEPLALDRPVLSKTITLKTLGNPSLETFITESRLPNGISVNSVIQGGNHVFTLEHVPAILHEQNSPPVIQRTPYLFFSTTKSWEPVAQYIQGKWEAQQDPHERLNQIIQEIIQPSMDPLTKLIAIHEWVTKRFRNVGGGYDAGYLHFRSTASMSSDLYGTLYDRTNLYLTLLALADVDVDVILSSPYPDQMLPNIALFTNVYLLPRMEPDGMNDTPNFTDRVWFHPVHGLTNWVESLAQATVYWVDALGGEPKPFQPVYYEAADNGILFQGDLEFRELSKAQGEGTLTLSGYFNASDWNYHPGNQETVCKQLMDKIMPGVTVNFVTVVYIGSVAVFKLTYTWENPTKSHHGFHLLSIMPSFLHTQFFTFQNRWEHRHTPLYFPHPFQENVKLTIRLPREGLTWDSLPENYEVAESNYRVSQQITQKDTYSQDVELLRETAVLENQIKASDYPVFWERWIRLQADRMHMFILKEE